MIYPYHKKLAAFIFIVAMFTLAACGADANSGATLEENVAQENGINNNLNDNIQDNTDVEEGFTLWVEGIEITDSFLSVQGSEFPTHVRDFYIPSLELISAGGFGALSVSGGVMGGFDIPNYSNWQFGEWDNFDINTISKNEVVILEDGYLYFPIGIFKELGLDVVATFDIHPTSTLIFHDDASEQHNVRIPSNIDMSIERLQQFYDFFHPFLVAFGVLPTLGDYDSRTPESEYVALEFVLSTGIFIHGRRGDIGIPYYGFTEYIGGKPVSDWSFQVTYEFLSSDYVDYKLLQYFGIEGFNHASIDFTEWFGFEYHEGRYYYQALAQGGASPSIPNIFEIYDNGDGVYFVRIQYLVIWPGIDEEEEHLQYNMAVIKAFENTFRMLYWKNDVPRDAEFPAL